MKRTIKMLIASPLLLLSILLHPVVILQGWIMKEVESFIK